MSVQILIGDCRKVLRGLPKESVHCVVTSPPYWGLRNYNVAGQLGLEPTLGEHIDVMVDVFREVRRVLRKDGTVWLNYGDCYATSANGRSAADTKAAGNDDRTFRDKPFSTVGPVYDPNYRKRTTGGIHAERRSDSGGCVVAGGILKSKDLCMMPARIALALQADGWWVRSEIIWHKPNPMPESITDRPTSSHEKIYLLARSERYYFDAEAVREGETVSKVSQKNRMQRVAATGGAISGGTGDTGNNVTGRNLRNVWTVATAPFPGAHFATFPPALIDPCIKAGCPERGTVLDPFGGAGTTGLVADRLKRNAILIELNPEYAAMARERIQTDAGMFGEVSAA